MRVASLVPAATEILRFLQVEPVGVSHACGWAGKPVLTESLLPYGLSQAEIDRRVRQAVAAGQSLYRVNARRLAELEPDLVLTQGVCEVCAATSGEVGRAVALLSHPVPTLSLQGTRLEHLWDDLNRVAQALGLEATPAIRGLQARLERVRQRVAGRRPPRVVFLEWLEPPFLGGHWVPDLIGAAGGVALGASPEAPSQRSDWAALARLEPEVVLFSFCGYDLAGALEVLKGWRPPWPSLQAAWALDAGPFCALTPRVVRGVEILAALFHGCPDLPAPCPEEAQRLL